MIVLSNTVGCSENNLPIPAFNKERAFQYLKDQVAFGPRVPGSEASAKCRDYFYKHFENGVFSVDSQSFIFFDPYSQTNIPMTNIIASYKANSDEPGIVLMAHYDSRPRTDFASDPNLKEMPIDGANDGASGVALLMEIGNLIAEQNPDISVDIVLVDGEDWGKSGDTQYYLLGSREFARRGIRGKYKFGIVVDMIADKDLTIYRERYSEQSAKGLNDSIFKLAKKYQFTGFIDTLKYAVQDDHLSLIAGGVPAVNLIDFDYKYWHTEFDTVDKCSDEALFQVGTIVTEIVYNRSLWQKIK